MKYVAIKPTMSRLTTHPMKTNKETTLSTNSPRDEGVKKEKKCDDDDILL